MSSRAAEATDSRRRPWRAAPYLHLLGLGALAFAQPVFDLLGRHPEFFVIRGSTPFDIVALAVALALVAPLPFLALRLAFAPLGDRVAALAQAALVAALLTLVTLQALLHAGSSSPAWLLAPVAGVALGALYLWLPATRLFATFLAPAALVLPALFLLQPGIRSLMSQQTADSTLRQSGASAPVFFLILDELGLPTLLDDAGRIDRRRYPHLAELAEGSTWFRDAATVSEYTSRAVPALLTGRHPRRGALPRLQDHPQNLFTVLGGDYAVYAAESLTHLCPPEVNRLERPVPSRRQRLESLALDAGVVWLHLTLPPRLVEDLPPIDHAWGDFVAPWATGPQPRGAGNDSDGGPSIEIGHDERVRASFGQRHELLPTLFETLGADDRSLYFFHLLLPHIPWEYYPSGRRYQRLRDPVMVREGAWPEELVPVAQTYARSLLQTMYADQVVGRFMARLRELGVYDRALVVVTSDHGATFRPGASRRLYGPESAAEILSVPLLIKAPGQREGRVVNHPVSLIDVLPTVMDLLGAPLSEPVDGISVWEVRETRPRFLSDRPEAVPVPPLYDDAVRAARELEALVGGAVTPEELLRVGSHPELLGRPLLELEPIPQGNIPVRVDGRERFASVDLEAPVLPLLISGTLDAPRGERCCDLAVAVGGRVLATTTSLPGAGLRHRWAALLPEDALSPGSNRVEILLVRADGDEARLEWPVDRRPEGYELILHQDAAAAAVVVDGAWLPVGDELRGWLGSAEIQGDTARITGWAADLGARAPAEEVIFFYQGRFAGAVAPALPDSSVVRLLGDSRFLESRFETELPALHLPGLEQNGLRAFALSSRGEAAELGYFYRHLERLPDGFEALRAGNGRLLRVEPSALRYWIDEVRREGDRLVVTGWAADPVAAKPASRIVAMLEGRYHSQGSTGRLRPRVADHLGIEGVATSGFRFPLPAALEEALARGDLRLFAVSGSRPVASELRLPALAPPEEGADAPE